MLIDALWFDLPIVAHNNPASAGVIESCGILCDDGEPDEAAALLYLLASDQELRSNIIIEGRRVRARSLPHTSLRTLLEAVGMRQPAPAMSGRDSWASD